MEDDVLELPLDHRLARDGALSHDACPVDTGTAGAAAVVAAWAVVLHRYSGSADVPLGSGLRFVLHGDRTFGEVEADAAAALAAGTPSGTGQVAVVAPGGKPAATTELALEPPDGGQARLWYARELFEPATAARVAGHLTSVLAAGTADRALTVARLPVLTPAEHAEIDGWNSRTEPCPEVCLHELLERHAAGTPDATALVFGSEEMTFRELNERANRLAHHLRALGVGPEVLVGLSLDRGFDLIVGIFGILKSGGAYLPLDPDYPADRLAFMLTDAAVSHLVTTSTLLDRLPDVAETKVLLDVDWPAIAERDATDPVSGATPDSLIYVMYTSGSTGKPKAAQMHHRGIVNVSEVGAPSICRQPGNRVLQLHSSSFDASVMEIVLSLTRGKTLVLAPRAEVLPGPGLVTLLREQRIETLVIPASSLASLPVESLPDLKMIFLEGETPSMEIVARWAERYEMFNAYGPTEASMWCAGGYLTGREERPPIGRQMTNVRFHVLDRYGERVPVGVAGELYIGGIGVTRGYRNRPELTAEKFVTLPSGERVYRTGDLVRYWPGGVLEFVGRGDSQVKIRGYRIELGEIEAALLRHPDVREAVVVADEPRPGYKRLVAYVVAPASFTADAAKSFLRQTLPSHFVPAAFVVLDELPRLPNGKLDRRSLPAPADDDFGGQDDAGEPSTDTERTLLEIWQGALGIDRLGVRDTFVDIGGDSLVAVMVVIEIEQAFGVSLQIGDLLSPDATVERIAADLDGAPVGVTQ